MPDRVWVLLQQPVVNEGADTAWATLYSSREKALASIGRDLTWTVSESGYQEATYVDPRGETIEYVLYLAAVDGDDA